MKLALLGLVLTIPMDDIYLHPDFGISGLRDW
jgi:hypothetical protein